MPIQPVLPPLHWSWEPSILIGLAGLNCVYFLLSNPLRRRLSLGAPVPVVRQLAFYLGSLLTLIALCSPIDQVGDNNLFSAHMIQHMLITYAAPPLWLLGLPAALFPRFSPPRQSWQIRLSSFLALLTSPLIAFMIFNGVILIWHLPAFYDFALDHEGVHILEHITFIAAALIGWSPALLPVPVTHLAKPARALYLFASTFPCTALGALFTFSNSVIYPFYASAPRLWGITALTDQQSGGLIMWLPGDLILMAAAFWILGHWLAQQERADNQHQSDETL